MTDWTASAETLFPDLHDRAWVIPSEDLLLTSRIALFAKTNELAHAEVWREAITDSLRAWVRDETSKSQRDFWRLFDSTKNAHADLPQFATAIKINFAADPIISIGPPAGMIGAASFSFGTFFPQDPKYLQISNWADEHNDYTVIDGQHRLFTVYETKRDLSVRSTKRAIRNVLLALQQCDETCSFNELISVIDTSLSNFILPLTRLKITLVYDGLNEIQARNTHDSVMSFRIHTGNSPPADHQACLSFIRAKMTISAERKNYAKVQMRKGARCVRNALCAWNPKTRFDQSSQDHSCTYRSTRFAGRWRARPNCPLARSA
jgi:hypothetical protein